MLKKPWYYGCMHVRFRSCVGISVVEELDEQILGTISGVLIHPDTGKIEGFLVQVGGFLAGKDLFIASMDIVRWGTRVHVRDYDCLAPVEDRIRLVPLLHDPRTILDQRIRTVDGAFVGMCRDFQFNTDTMAIEWLFPRRFFRWGIALPISEVVEVQPAAIIVRNPVTPETQKEEDTSLQDTPIPEISEVPVAGRSA